MTATFLTTMKSLDEQAAASGNRKEFWGAVGLCLVVWSSGGIPAASFDPRVHDHLKPLFEAYRQIGAPLREAVDARLFGT